MAGKHKTSLLGWHPRSAELEAWIRAEAEKRGSLADVLEDGMSAAMEASKPVAAKPPRPRAGRKTGEVKSGSEEKCRHPVNLRIGTICGACRQDVGKKT